MLSNDQFVTLAGWLLVAGLALLIIVELQRINREAQDKE